QREDFLSLNKAAACAIRRYVAAAADSSATQLCRRHHNLIRLSCEISITESSRRGASAGGIRKETPSARKGAITLVTVTSSAAATSQSSLSLVGRRTCRLSRSVSVRHLNTMAAHRLARSSGNA